MLRRNLFCASVSNTHTEEHFYIILWLLVDSLWPQPVCERAYARLCSTVTDTKQSPLFPLGESAISTLRDRECDRERETNE